ncbi:MAG: hypothetical protein NTX24_04385 [Candidatus Pacearchaeota archaeon]|nr:hypothetical protein [Candidatus Pacearchaeota archaeon]
MSTKLNKKDREFLSKNISYLSDNWGRIKAGKITYSRYKHIFEEGRKKAIESIHKRSCKFDINLPLNKELAYFIGLFIGDGFTNKYQRYYLTQFTGDKKEKQFYETLISDYCKKLFNVAPKIRYDRSCNAIRVNLYSVDIFNLITKRFQISAGRKSRTVLIPKEILDSDSTIIKSCIRGLYDAEGCVFFDKRKSYAAPYPRIDLHMNNLELLKQVYNILNKFEIKCTLGTIEENLRVTIYGEEQVKKFVKEIGFFNPKHLERLGAFNLKN